MLCLVIFSLSALHPPLVSFLLGVFLMFCSSHIFVLLWDVDFCCCRCFLVGCVGGVGAGKGDYHLCFWQMMVFSGILPCEITPAVFLPVSHPHSFFLSSP